MSEPVIIDTDPGLDDALALFLACASPKLEILGITTVAGNLALSGTTRNALKLLHYLDRNEIPVIAGCAGPLRRESFEVADIHGKDGLGGAELPSPERQALDIHAVEWLGEELLRRPTNTVRILALGPLTNLAHLVESRPAAAKRISGIVAMGGAVREAGNVTEFAEFNIATDPEAAAIVFGSGIPVTLVPLDVTRKVLADREWNAALLAGGGRIARMANGLIEAYLRNLVARRVAKGASTHGLAAKFPMHDPCVILHALDPSLFRAEDLPLRVVTDGFERDGATVIDPHSKSLVEVLTGVDGDHALAFILERLTALP